MRRHCSHSGWTVVARRYTPPANLTKITAHDSRSSDTAERAIHGFTVIEQRCALCGWTGFATVVGDQR